MPGLDKIPTYLTPDQRHALTQIPADLSDRDIARYYQGVTVFCQAPAQEKCNEVARISLGKQVTQRHTA